jgi:SAM-dependent methyltransferase
VRAKWKNFVRRYPDLARILQFVFDPAYVSHATRNKLLTSLRRNALVLNIGAGVKRLPRVSSINLDIELYGNVDVVADAQEMPFADSSFDCVVLEYVVEHVSDSSRIVNEIYRVLRPGGYIYATAPFLQAYHGNPDDYYRFTQSGFREFWRKFRCIECKPFGGPTSALVCTVKEYLSIVFSFNSRVIYSILSQILIIPFFPLKYLDLVLVKTKNSHNIAFSLLYVGKK